MLVGPNEGRSGPQSPYPPNWVAGDAEGFGSNGNKTKASSPIFPWPADDTDSSDIDERVHPGLLRMPCSLESTLDQMRTVMPGGLPGNISTACVFPP